MSQKVNTGVVAIVDDDEAVRAAIEDLLSSVGIKARSFASADEFLRSGIKTEIACLVSDIRMPGMTGLELQAMVARAPDTNHFVTAYGNTRMREQALRSWRYRFLANHFMMKLARECTCGAGNAELPAKSSARVLGLKRLRNERLFPPHQRWRES